MEGSKESREGSVALNAAIPGVPSAELRKLRRFKFDAERWDLRSFLKRILLQEDHEKVPLELLHTLPQFQGPQRYGRPTQINRRWRNKGGSSTGDMKDEWRALYGEFVDTVVRSEIERDLKPEDRGKDLVYQNLPVLRCQVPSSKALGQRHRDSQYGRQPGEINVWLPLTPVEGNNSLWVESEEGKGDFRPLETDEFGFAFRAYLHGLEHLTMPNDTGKTRVSLDFRVVPEVLHTDAWDGKDAFIIGRFYTSTALERKWREQWRKGSAVAAPAAAAAAATAAATSTTATAEAVGAPTAAITAEEATVEATET